MNSLVILVAFEARAIMKRRLKWINNSCHIFKFWQTILQKKKVTWKKKARPFKLLLKDEVLEHKRCILKTNQNSSEWVIVF